MLRILSAVVLGVVLALPAMAQEANRQKPAAPAASEIDSNKARELLRKRQAGDRLTAEEAAYLERAIAARRAGQQGRPGRAGGSDSRAIFGKDKVGFKPLTEMTGEDRYQDQDGGLYGGGQNAPPEEHRKAAEAALAKIEPLDARGQPAVDGRVVFVSISMSNATQEFSKFKEIADRDPRKSPSLTIVDCAQGGQAMAEWVAAGAQPWTVAERRITNAGVTLDQVQIAWIKLANKGPRGDLAEHGKKLEADTLAVIQNAKDRFPNLRIAYLSSRIYGGYTMGALNPEPYAYESAFPARWLIQRQMKGDKALNFEASRGEVKSPLLLWGPYLWADGVTPRAADKLVYTREDLAQDGTHPSQAGREKVAKLMLEFFANNELTRPWFAR
ncbi:MAG: hypothetical protein L0211_20320 [Planctomycetaceae bacterium]|nr:hypothetical protein [Planctomycetaceae bacterium]